MSCKKGSDRDDAGEYLSRGDNLDLNPEQNENITSTLQDDIIKEILKAHFECKTKVGPDVIPLVRQLSNCLVMECWHRAARQAEKEGCTEIKVEHIEECIAQIMLDLP